MADLLAKLEDRSSAVSAQTGIRLALDIFENRVKCIVKLNSLSANNPGLVLNSLVFWDYKASNIPPSKG